MLRPHIPGLAARPPPLIGTGSAADTVDVTSAARAGRGPRRVLVLQAGARPGPWTCRSLATAGHAVVAAHDGRSGGLRGTSRWAPGPLRSPSPEVEAEGYVDWLRTVVESLAIDVVVPATEGVTHLIADMPDLGRARRAGPDRRVYRALCDKDGLAVTAAAAGVLSPRGVVLGPLGGGGPLPAAPCIVKPVSSSTPHGGRVVYAQAVAAATDAERDAAVERIITATGAAVVQEVVRGTRWRLHVARGATGMVGVAWRTVRSHPRDTGMSSVSAVAPVPAALGDAVARLLRVADYRGVGSIQVFETADGWVVHDANLRPVFTTGASLRAGFDLPRMAVDVAMGGEPRLEGRVRPVRYVWLTGELQEGIRAIARGDAADAARALGDVAGAALLPRRVLDPTDPRVVADILAGALARARARRTAG